LRLLREPEQLDLACYEEAAERLDPDSARLTHDLLIPVRHHHVRLLAKLVDGLDPRNLTA